jgi:hypothetical protein
VLVVFNLIKLKTFRKIVVPSKVQNYSFLGLARCISLSSLGIFVYSELLHETFHPKIREAIQVAMTNALKTLYISKFFWEVFVNITEQFTYIHNFSYLCTWFQDKKRLKK